ncbi:MAG: hypothetical protein ACK4ZW_11810 [Blastomonas sp.]
MVMKTQQLKVGKAVVRWGQAKTGEFSGTVIMAGKPSENLTDADEKRLLARLRNLAGTLEPNYFGMEEAIARYLRFMPGGFSAERNLTTERKYKVGARDALAEILPLGQAFEASSDDARRVREAGAIWINLLSPFESMHLKEAIASNDGPAFLRAAAKFTAGDFSGGVAGMNAAMSKHGRLSWPTATYFPFLWSPVDHMFLKPTVTRDFAERIGHRYQYDYSPDIEKDVYESLLELADLTMTNLTDLSPKDRIDVQSFIYVVGGYSDIDLPNGN